MSLENGPDRVCWWTRHATWKKGKSRASPNDACVFRVSNCWDEEGFRGSRLREGEEFGWILTTLGPEHWSPFNASKKMGRRRKKEVFYILPPSWFFKILFGHSFTLSIPDQVASPVPQSGSWFGTWAWRGPFLRLQIHLSPVGDTIGPEIARTRRFLGLWTKRPRIGSFQIIEFCKSTVLESYHQRIGKFKTEKATPELWKGRAQWVAGSKSCLPLWHIHEFIHSLLAVIHGATAEVSGATSCVACWVEENWLSSCLRAVGWEKNQQTNKGIR